MGRLIFAGGVGTSGPDSFGLLLALARARRSRPHLDEKAYWWQLDRRRYGTVPHAGFGRCFERMLMFVTGMANIRDMIPFARTPGTADF